MAIPFKVHPFIQDRNHQLPFLKQAKQRSKPFLIAAEFRLQEKISRAAKVQVVPTVELEKGIHAVGYEAQQPGGPTRNRPETLPDRLPDLSHSESKEPFVNHTLRLFQLRSADIRVDLHHHRPDQPDLIVKTSNSLDSDRWTISRR